MEVESGWGGGGESICKDDPSSADENIAIVGLHLSEMELRLKSKLEALRFRAKSVPQTRVQRTFQTTMSFQRWYV